jgi:hypothetical protein
MRYNEKIQLKLYEYNGTQFVLQAIVDDYEQISFEHNLYSAGAFTVSINYNIPNAKLFRRGIFIQFGSNPDDFGEIYTLTNSIGSDGKGSEKLNISGYDARYLFKRRVIKNLNSNDVWAMTAKGEICLRNLIYSECGLGAEEKRRLPIENIIPSEADASGDIYSVSEAYTNLYDVLCVIATQSQIGWSVKFIDGELKLVCFNGTDKRHEVFFATDYESLASGSFSDSFSSYANIIYIGGKGEGSERDLYEGIANQEGFLIADSGTYLTTENGEKFILSYDVEPSALNRFEAFDNQSSMTTEEEYENDAESMLTQYAQTLNVSGAGLAKCPFVFREQYDVGDIITLRFSEKEYAIQILSVTEQWSKGSYTLNFSFGKPQNSLEQQLSIMMKKIQKSASKINSVSSVKWYTTPTDSAQGEADVTFGTLGFTGSGGTFTLYLDDERTGAKNYMIYVKNLSGALTLTSGVSGADNLILTAGTYVTSVFVAEDGNILRMQ